ncbi:MAG: acylneuraminate cytidylyltransferase family protein, partial [Lachnospiraceae bacterium]|nr:acylneuraminate cytidylyltransferase family protein [Lachnospiraceae bacterium]
MRNLAVIPARSGSKGLKDKNIRKLNGKHLIGYSIEAAIRSGLFDCVHVSTDNSEYGEIAMRYGADVSFLRTAELSADTADTWDMARYVVNTFRKMGRDFDRITVLQPTSPLRTEEDIRNAYRMFEEKNAESVISVCEVNHSPLFMKPLNKDLSMEGFIDLSRKVRRQEQEKYYRLNGAIYMLDISVLNDIQKLYGRKSFALIMPEERSVDIDTIQ